MKTSRLDAAIVGRMTAAQEELQAATKQLVTHILDRLGMRLGRQVRDRDTGDIYRLEDIQIGSVAGDEVRGVALFGRRVYKTRRAPSQTLSTLSPGSVEPYNPDAD